MLADGLAPWQEPNVTAFLASGITAAPDPVLGKPYEDGSAQTYLPMFRQPVLIFSAEAERLGAVRARAVERDLQVAIHTRDLFATGNDDDNRAQVRDVPPDEPGLVGVALHGRKNAIDRTLEGIPLHG